MSYFENLFISADQFVNTLIGGKPDETLSARAYREKDKRFAWKFFYFLFNLLFLNPNHCYESYLSEVKRKQLPREYES